MALYMEIRLFITMNVVCFYCSAFSVADKRIPSKLFTDTTLEITNHTALTDTSGNFSSDATSSSSWSFCPTECICKYLSDETVDVVDCSSRSLRRVPSLPPSARDVYLQDNEILDLTCSTLKYMRNLETLDLSQNRNIMLYNCSFVHVIKLQSLRLSRCQLPSVPAGMFDSLQDLVELDISENNIRNIMPYLFSSMHKLKRLDLSINRLSALRNNTFQGLASLVFLSLKANVLRYVPGTFERSAFRGLTSLESLHLEVNQPDAPYNFTYPDEALAQVPSLHQVWLDGFPQVLGRGFSSLRNLTHLSFTGFCCMSELPPEFFSNITTKQPLHLEMVHCEIRYIPPELFQFLPTIRSLDLAWNMQLSMDGFERASMGLQNSDLEVLNITHIVQPFPFISVIKRNNFQYLSNTKLKVLVVESCHVTNVAPEALLDLPETLEYLSFQNNNIIAVTGMLVLNHLSNLKTLKGSHQMHYYVKRSQIFGRARASSGGSNNVPEMPMKRWPVERVAKKHKSFFKTLFPLNNETVNLLFKHEDEDSFCDTPIKALMTTKRSVDDPAFSVLLPFPPKLEELYISDIKLSYNIPKAEFINNKVLKYIDISSNNIKCFGGPIYGLPVIEYLDLSRNYCFQMNPLFFSRITSLRTLLLYQNWLGRPLAEDVHGVIFSFLPLLETLDLSSNVIEDLPKVTFLSNKHLRVLNLSNNELSQFRPSLVNNNKLETLDLSSNLLEGLSESTCKQLLNIKRNNSNFTVRVSGNKRFMCNCDNLYFLRFLLEEADIFENISTFQCMLGNGSSVGYAGLAYLLPELTLECVAQPIFIAVLLAFFLVTGSLVVCALYHYKRWQWKYLYYVVRSRLHIGSTHITYTPDADVFVTYDQDDLPLRRMMRQLFLPRLHQLGLTTVFGEVDFGGGPVEPSIAGAVTNTRKTLVFLSKDIFQEFRRQTEVNLAIMHELHLRRPVLVPVLLLIPEALPVVRQRSPDNSQPQSLDSVIEDRRVAAEASRNRIKRTQREPRSVNDLSRLRDLVASFPPELATFLQGQSHRCLVYTGDSEHFWRKLRTVILEEY